MDKVRFFAAIALLAALPCIGEELAGRYAIEEKVVLVLAQGELLEGEALVDLDIARVKTVVRDEDGYYFIVTRPDGYFLSIGERSFGPFSNVSEVLSAPGGLRYQKMELDEKHYLLFDASGRSFGPYFGTLWEEYNLYEVRRYFRRANWVVEHPYIVNFDYLARRSFFEGAEEPIYDRDGSVVGRVRVYVDRREFLFESGARVSAACPDRSRQNKIDTALADESTGDWVLLCENPAADKPLGGGTYWPGYSIIENGGKIGDFLSATLHPLEGGGWAAGYKAEDGFYVIDRAGRIVGPAPIPWRQHARFSIEASDEAGEWAGRAWYYDYDAQATRSYLLAWDGTISGPFESIREVGFAGDSLSYDFFREGAWYRRTGDRTYGPFDDIESVSKGGPGFRAAKGTVFLSFDGSRLSSQDLGRAFLLGSVALGGDGAVKAYIGAVMETIDANGEPQVQYGLFAGGEKRIEEIETGYPGGYSYRVTDKGNEVLVQHPEEESLEIYAEPGWRRSEIRVWVNGERMELDDKEPIFGGYDAASDSLFWLENRDGEIVEKRVRF